MRLMLVEPIGWPYFYFIKMIILGLANSLVISKVVDLAIGGAISIKTDVIIGFFELSLY